MQAIKTQFYGPTNSRGARMRAGCAAGFLFVPYQYDLDLTGNHRFACEKLRDKLGWTLENNYSPMVGGEYADCHYWVFGCDTVTLN